MAKCSAKELIESLASEGMMPGLDVEDHLNAVMRALELANLHMIDAMKNPDISAYEGGLLLTINMAIKAQRDSLRRAGKTLGYSI